MNPVGGLNDSLSSFEVHPFIAVLGIIFTFEVSQSTNGSSYSWGGVRKHKTVTVR